jgi:hypothetical protein
MFHKIITWKYLEKNTVCLFYISNVFRRLHVDGNTDGWILEEEFCRTANCLDKTQFLILFRDIWSETRPKDRLPTLSEVFRVLLQPFLKSTGIFILRQAKSLPTSLVAACCSLYCEHQALHCVSVRKWSSCTYTNVKR